MRVEDLFFSHREAERTLEHFASAKRENSSFRKSNDDLSLQELIRHQHQLIRLLLADIKKGLYQTAPASTIKLFADKERFIHKFPLFDQFVLAHFARCLAQLLEPHYPDALFSFRPGRGNIGALHRVAEYIKSKELPLYVLRRDVRNFGESMRHEAILEDFEEYFPKSTLRPLLEQFLRFEKQTSTGLAQNSLGLPNGSYLQLIFENLYLAKLDRALASKMDSAYLRFGDDIVFVTSQEELFLQARAEAESIATSRGLEFHPEKSKDLLLLPSHLIPRANAPSLQPCARFEYLGMVVTGAGALQLPKEKQRVLQQELKTLIRRVAKNTAHLSSHEERTLLVVQAVRKLLFGKSEQRKASGKNYLIACSDSAQLREIDRWLALQILSTIGNRGFKKSTFRNNAYAELRVLGLPSIVHQRNTHAR